MDIKNYNKGFTLIELLVVIVIIGILATLATVALSSARSKARDARRISDMKQLQSALQLYYSNESAYPAIITPGMPLIGPISGQTFMLKIPANPRPVTDGTCASGAEYTYTQLNSGQYYGLAYCLGGVTGGTQAGPWCVTPDAVAETPGLVKYFPGNTGANPQPECPPCVCGDCSGLSCSGPANATCTVGNVTYRAVSVDTQCWLDKNINLGVMEPNYSDTQSDDSTIEKYCGCGSGASCAVPDSAICDSDGALYSWAEAMYLPSTCNFSNTCSYTTYLTGSGASAKRQGICPKGWHIPSDYEFSVLEHFLNPGSIALTNNPDYYADQIAGGSNSTRGTDVGTKLKVGGSSGLNFILTGYRSPSADFTSRTSTAFYWTSSFTLASVAWYRRLDAAQSTRGNLNSNDSRYGFAVRCLKD
ncbi:MAG: FISUMP domain-containing protein [Candidatus Falkowbacteria bacterium]